MNPLGERKRKDRKRENVFESGPGWFPNPGMITTDLVYYRLVTAAPWGDLPTVGKSEHQSDETPFKEPHMSL